MADISKVRGNIRAGLSGSINAGDTSLTLDNDFASKTVASNGYLAIGEQSDFSDLTYEVARYSSFIDNGNGTSTLGGLTRGLDNTTDQDWASGITVGTNIPGPLLSRLPEQEEDFDMGDNSIDNVLSILDSAQSSPPTTPGNGDFYMDDGTNTEDGFAGLRQFTNGDWEDVGAGDGGSNAFAFFMG